MRDPGQRGRVSTLELLRREQPARDHAVGEQQYKEYDYQGHYLEEQSIGDLPFRLNNGADQR